jgi:hypothetical protein
MLKKPILIASILVIVQDNEVRFLMCDFLTYCYILENFQRKTILKNWGSTKGLRRFKVQHRTFLEKLTVYENFIQTFGLLQMKRE